MKKFITTAMMLSGLVAYAQDGRVGINTAEPKATLEMTPNTDNAVETATTNESFLIPRLSKTRIANIADGELVKGTLVYVNDYTYTASPANDKVANILTEGFHYYDGIIWQPIQKTVPKFDYILTNDGSALVQWMNKYKDIEIDMNTYDDMHNVKTIGTDVAFGANIKKFIIKDGVTTIGDRAFQNSPDTEIVLPSSIEEVKIAGFAGNKKLTTLDLPNLKKIGDSGFSGAESITTINLPNVTEVGEAAFNSNLSLTSVSMPNVTVLKRSTFYNTPELVSVDLPNVTRLESGVFGHPSTYDDGGVYEMLYPTKPKLRTISLPKATHIGENALQLMSLETIDLPEAETIERYVYNSGGRRTESKLTTLNLPKVKSIGEWAFSTHKLTTLHLPEVVTIERNAFGLHSGSDYDQTFVEYTLSTLTLPKAETIKEEAFVGNKLTTIELPNVKTIGRYAFGQDRNSYGGYYEGKIYFTDITIGPNITDIGDYAFYNGSSTSTAYPNHNITITIQATTPPSVGYSSFPRTRYPYVTTFRVPSASLDAYKTAITSRLGTPNITDNNYVIVGY